VCSCNVAYTADMTSGWKEVDAYAVADTIRYKKQEAKLSLG